MASEDRHGDRVHDTGRTGIHDHRILDAGHRWLWSCTGADRLRGGHGAVLAGVSRNATPARMLGRVSPGPVPLNLARNAADHAKAPTRSGGLLAVS